MKTLESIYENDKEFHEVLADAMTRNCLDKFVTRNDGTFKEGDDLDTYYATYNDVPIHILITSQNKNIRIKIGTSYYNLSKRHIANSFGKFSDDEEVVYENFKTYIEHHIIIENEFSFEPRRGY